MKIKSMTLTNFAKYDNVSVNFDENITYLIGPNGAGKSSLGIHGPWFVMQGVAEKAQKGNSPLIGERFRFIGENASFADGEIVFYDEKIKSEITATRHMTKDSQKLTFIAPPGVVLDQEWLNSIFNIFLIAPKRFIELTSKEQSKALNIDTATHDQKIANFKTELTILNRELKSYGELQAPEKVEKVDVMLLQQQKEAEQLRIKKEQENIDFQNKKLKEKYDADRLDVENETDAFNKAQDEKIEFIDTATELLNSLIEMGYSGDEVEKWISTLPKPDKKKLDENWNPLYEYPSAPEYLKAADQSKIAGFDQQILQATLTNEKALAYSNYLTKLASKIKKEKEIDDNKKAQKDAEQARIDYLKTCRLPFDNLTIDEEGGLLLDGRPLKEEYWSTGELLKFVPIILSSTMPEGSTQLKYVYLQQFNLMDEDKQKQIVDYLVEKGFQLVIEYVGKAEIPDKNCIVLSQMKVVNPKPVKEQPEKEEPKNTLF